MSHFFFTVFNNSFHSRASYTFYGTHAKTHCIIFYYCKFIIGFIDVGTQNFQPHALAFLHKESNLLYVVHITGQYSRHIFCRIMRL